MIFPNTIGIETNDMIKCDKCGDYGFPDEFAYIGPKNRADDSCTMFQEWEQICLSCEELSP